MTKRGAISSRPSADKIILFRYGRGALVNYPANKEGCLSNAPGLTRLHCGIICGNQLGRWHGALVKWTMFTKKRAKN
jgi:hypothetical protein